MARYTVQHAYAAERDGDQLGPWKAGEEVELEGHVAEWVLRDSPGTLAEVKPAPKQARAKQPAADRQHKGGANR